MDQQRVARAVLALDARHDAGAVRRRLEQLRLEPDLGEQAGDVLGRLPLPLAPAGAVVDALEPDEVAADLDDLVLGVRHGWLLASWAVRRTRNPSPVPTRPPRLYAPGRPVLATGPLVRVAELADALA